MMICFSMTKSVNVKQSKLCCSRSLLCRKSSISANTICKCKAFCNPIYLTVCLRLRILPMKAASHTQLPEIHPFKAPDNLVHSDSCSNSIWSCYTTLALTTSFHDDLSSWKAALSPLHHLHLHLHRKQR